MSDEKTGKKSAFQVAGVAVATAGAIMAGGWNMRDYMAQMEVLETKVAAAEKALTLKEEALQAKEEELSEREAALAAAQEAGKQLETDYQEERDLWGQRLEALGRELESVRETAGLALQKGQRALGSMPPSLKGFEGYQRDSLIQRKR